MIWTFKATLMLRGINLDFDEISKQLSLNPTKTGQKGDRGLTDDFWFYSREYNYKHDGEEVSSDGINELLLTFLDEIKSIKELNIQALSKRIWVFVQSNFAQFGFSISNDTLCKMADLGLPLDFSMLSWGEVED